ncbi:MAG: hypothetical protein DRP94_01805 [Candidatus Latescibacterota bacterium]|nr:MAG: hypothetical protein DRP94_01805 [Candidatus Latescibacterota bacterium]RKY73124.1 MAG: hypothetical protein DRQ14_04815 [Candidatus Latescibacterota bacterium]HDH99913.1 TolC family protein [Bacillota bacterium]
MDVKLFRYAWVALLALLLPACALSDSLDLEGCIEVALKSSPELAVAEGRVTKAEIALKDAKAALLPKVELSGGYHLNDVYSRLRWDERNYNLSISASATPYDGGRSLLRIAQAKESLRSAEAGYAAARAAVVLEVVRRYYEVLKASELLKVRKEALLQKRKHLELAEAKFHQGLVPRSDVLKAEAEVAAARLDSLQAEGELKIAYARLKDAMGMELEAPVRIKPVRFVEEELPTFEECLREALRNRPEIAQARASVEIRRYNLKLAKLETWPVLSVSGSYNIYADRLLGSPVDRSWRRNTDWVFGVGLSFPIFDGGVRKRAVREAGVSLKESELDYLNMERAIRLEVRTAYINLRTAAERVKLSEKQVESAQESYEAALGRYEVGVAPITEVIDAQVALSEGKVNHTRAVYDYLYAKAALDKAVGRTPYVGR